jgi:hypothetical protein
MTEKETGNGAKGHGRRIYRAPQLREYGSLRDLVRMKGGGSTADVPVNTKLNVQQ